VSFADPTVRPLHLRGRPPRRARRQPRSSRCAGWCAAAMPTESPADSETRSGPQEHARNAGARLLTPSTSLAPRQVSPSRSPANPLNCGQARRRDAATTVRASAIPAGRVHPGSDRRAPPCRCSPVRPGSCHHVEAGPGEGLHRPEPLRITSPSRDGDLALGVPSPDARTGSDRSSAARLRRCPATGRQLFEHLFD
jgi:hypothetical protein